MKYTVTIHISLTQFHLQDRAAEIRQLTDRLQYLVSSKNYDFGVITHNKSQQYDFDWVHQRLHEVDSETESEPQKSTC